jgi:cyanophycin synthetase
MFRIVRTQVDVILPSGFAVLNADDPEVVEMADLCDGKVIFYGLDQSLPAIAQHREAGQRTVFLRDARIVMSDGAHEIAVLPLSGLKPAKAAQPSEVMAAVAAGWALNLAPELIAAGLRTFELNPKNTPY